MDLIYIQFFCLFKKYDLINTGLPEGASTVINACGQNIFAPSLFSQRFQNQLFDSRVGTNLALRNAILKAKVKPKTFITMSGVGLYKADPSIVHDESSTEFSNDFWSHLIEVRTISNG